MQLSFEKRNRKRSDEKSLEYTTASTFGFLPNFEVEEDLMVVIVVVVWIFDVSIFFETDVFSWLIFTKSKSTIDILCRMTCILRVKVHFFCSVRPSRSWFSNLNQQQSYEIAFFVRFLYNSSGSHQNYTK